MTKDEIWTTRDERKIPVGEMEDSHVRNTLRMLLRRRRRKYERAVQLIAKDENMPPSLYVDPPYDEMWIDRGGHEIPVSQMSDAQARNALRRIIRKMRHVARQKAQEFLDSLPMPDEQFFERPDNHTILAGFQAKYGDGVKVVHSSMGGMHGGTVYINGEKRGWYGGI